MLPKCENSFVTLLWILALGKEVIYDIADENVSELVHVFVRHSM